MSQSEFKESMRPAPIHFVFFFFLIGSPLCIVAKKGEAGQGLWNIYFRMARGRGRGRNSGRNSGGILPQGKFRTFVF